MRGELQQMSLIKPEGSDGSPDPDLVRTREHYENAIDMFQVMTRNAARGELGTESENAKAIRGLGSATQLLFSEKQKVETSLNKQAGVVGGYAIDFDAARREIRRRMALLRAARDD
ncbi:MAG: hypothetical protein ACSHXD_12360 [Marinosulfonomonas sp.]